MRNPDPAWLLRLYPRRWRERYGTEFTEFLRSEPMTVRLALDVVAGALDARWTPQPIQGETTMAATWWSCKSVAFTREEQIRNNAIVIGGSLAFALVMMAVSVAVPGGRRYAQFLITFLFPVLLVLSGYWTYLKPYRRAVRVRIMLVELVLVLAIVGGAAWIAARL